MESTSLPLARPAGRDPERERLVRRARVLAWLGISWHGIEATIAIAAGLIAGSIALVGFGADSLIESAAGFVLLCDLRLVVPAPTEPSDELRG